jgi:hypothetical protein
LASRANARDVRCLFVAPDEAWMLLELSPQRHSEAAPRQEQVLEAPAFTE